VLQLGRIGDSHILRARRGLEARFGHPSLDKWRNSFKKGALREHVGWRLEIALGALLSTVCVGRGGRSGSATQLLSLHRSAARSDRLVPFERLDAAWHALRAKRDLAWAPALKRYTARLEGPSRAAISAVCAGLKEDVSHHGAGGRRGGSRLSHVGSFG